MRSQSWFGRGVNRLITMEAAALSSRPAAGRSGMSSAPPSVSRTGTTRHYSGTTPAPTDTIQHHPGTTPALSQHHPGTIRHHPGTNRHHPAPPRHHSGIIPASPWHDPAPLRHYSSITLAPSVTASAGIDGRRELPSVESESVCGLSSSIRPCPSPAITVPVRLLRRHSSIRPCPLRLTADARLRF